MCQESIESVGEFTQYNFLLRAIATLRRASGSTGPRSNGGVFTGATRATGMDYVGVSFSEVSGLSILFRWFAIFDYSYTLVSTHFTT